MTATAMTTPDDSPHRLRLTAIRAADSRRTRLENDLDAAKKRWKDKLTEATQAFTALLPKNEADLPDDARARLVDLFKADKEHTKVVDAKAAEVKGLKKKLEKADAAFLELVRSQVEDGQVALALGDATLTEGLGVSDETARGLFAAIAEVEESGGKLDADMEHLKATLAKQGYTKLSLEDDDSEPADADDSDDDDGDDGEPPKSERHLEAVQ